MKRFEAYKGVRSNRDGSPAATRIGALRGSSVRPHPCPSPSGIGVARALHEARRKALMRVLVTNDDGIHAPGLKLLEDIAAQLSDDVWVVAPETDQSGVSHSLSLNDP